jgi:hypothetical protein
LSAIEQGDPQAAEQLLPLVYDELRQCATGAFSLLGRMTLAAPAVRFGVPTRGAARHGR